MAAVALENSTLFADANLIAYWKLENTSDSKGSYTLTNNGTTPFNAALFNNGADFGTGNTSKYLSRTDSLGITSPSTAFTVMGWFKLNAEISSGAQFPFFMQVGSNIRQPFIQYEYFGGNRRISVDLYHNSGGEHSYPVYKYGNIGTSSWHHIAYVWNGSNTLEGFYDGTSFGTSSPDTSAGSATSANMSLGSLAGGAGTFTDWILDDWAVFNRALTSTEIADHYSGADALPTGGGGAIAFFMN